MAKRCARCNGTKEAFTVRGGLKTCPDCLELYVAYTVNCAELLGTVYTYSREDAIKRFMSRDNLYRHYYGRECYRSRGPTR